MSQQPTKSNGPVLQRFPELEGLYPSTLVFSLNLKAFIPLNLFFP